MSAEAGQGRARAEPKPSQPEQSQGGTDRAKWSQAEIGTAEPSPGHDEPRRAEPSPLRAQPNPSRAHAKTFVFSLRTSWDVCFHFIKSAFRPPLASPGLPWPLPASPGRTRAEPSQPKQSQAGPGRAKWRLAEPSRALAMTRRGELSRDPV